MSTTKLQNPPAPMVLLDARHYKRCGQIHKGRDGNYRWSARNPIPRWAKAGRIAAPFNSKLKLEEAGKPQPPIPTTWHDQYFNGDV